MLRIVRERDSRKYSPLPSLTLMAAMSLWSAYAVFVIPTIQLFVANFSGVIIPLVYMTIFALYEPTFLGRIRHISSAIFILVATWGIAVGIFLGGVPDAASVFGWFVSAVNCTFFIAPLKRLRDAIYEQDVSRVPTLLTYVQIGQSAVWMSAALLLGDPFILGVNTIGEAFAILQLAIILYVKRLSHDKQRHRGEELGGSSISSSPTATPDISEDCGLDAVVSAPDVVLAPCSHATTTE